jgi:MtaA/CmuA family methyltransferase
MNGRERYDAMLRGEAVDFLPRVPILMQFAAEEIGSNYGRYAESFTVLTEAHLHCAREFGIDQLSVISDPYREASGFGAEVTFDPSGPGCARAPLQDSRNLALLEHPDPRLSPRMRDRVEAVRRFAKEGQGEFSIMGWIEGPAAEAADLRGVQNFLFDLYDDPTFLGELMDRCVEVGIEFARAQIEAGADTIGIGDAIASQISPTMYEELVQPRQKELLTAIRKMGARIRLHICGNITHLLPGIADLPLDILDLDHLVDLATAREKIPSPVALAGNIDPVAGVSRGTRESIRSQVEECYRIAGNPFLVNAGCEVPPATPRENFRALCDPIAYRS